MDHQKRDPLEELAWLAYISEQLGWNGLAEKISDELAAFSERQDELQRRREHHENGGHEAA